MVCMHCLRTIHTVLRGCVVVWADETNDPFFCPKARSLAHKPCPSDHLHDAMPCDDCSYLGA